MNLPFQPQTPQAFIRLMEEIWDTDALHLYREWHNANRVARAINLRRTGSSFNRRSGETINVYRGFPPPHHLSGVRINVQGSSIAQASHPHRDGAYAKLQEGVAE